MSENYLRDMVKLMRTTRAAREQQPYTSLAASFGFRGTPTIAAHSTSRPMIERHFPELDEEGQDQGKGQEPKVLTHVVLAVNATEEDTAAAAASHANVTVTVTPVVDEASGTETVQEEEKIPKKKKKKIGRKVKVVKSKKVKANPSTTGESSIEEVTPQSRVSKPKVSKVKARVDVESEQEEPPRVKASKVSVSKLNVKVPATKGQPSRQSLAQEEHPPKVKAKSKKHVSISEAAPTYATDIVDESEGSSPPRRSAKDIARKLTKHYVLKSSPAEAKPKMMYVSDLIYAGRPAGKVTQNSTHMRIIPKGERSDWAFGTDTPHNTGSGPLDISLSDLLAQAAKSTGNPSAPVSVGALNPPTLEEEEPSPSQVYTFVDTSGSVKNIRRSRSKKRKAKKVVTENDDNGNDAKKVKKGKKKRSSKSNSDQPNDAGTSEVTPKASASTAGVSASEPVVSAKASQTSSKSMVLDKNKKKKIKSSSMDVPRVPISHRIKPRKSPRNLKEMMQGLLDATTGNNSVENFQAVVDMRGFKNDQIHLKLNGRQLVIDGYREANPTNVLSARRVVEVVSIPVGVNLHRLMMARRFDGSVIIEYLTHY